MSYSIVGNTGAKLQKRETQFDPEAGYTDIEIWTGPKEAIQGKFNLMSGAGWRCVMSHTGPCWTMTAQIGGTGAIEVWELASEWAVIDIRQSPYLGTLAVDFITLNLWFESIREDMTKRVMISYADVGKRYMAKLMARGEESFRQSRQVLRRRLCNPRDYSAVFPISSPDAVYTTSKLIETCRHLTASTTDSTRALASNSPVCPSRFMTTRRSRCRKRRATGHPCAFKGR